MKRIMSAVSAVLILMLLLTGCGGKDRVLFRSGRLSRYIDLGDYKGIPVDTSSDTHLEYVDEVIENDIKGHDLYEKKTEGKVADGDTVNIDYVGRKDGIPFEGGTAEGYDLKIGSGSFIDGFEDGLIDVTIGDTVDLELTFPDGYQATELAGKDVVFSVKVNYVKTDNAREPEEYYSDLDFETYEEYQEDITERAIKNYLLDTVTANSEVKKYPKKDKEIMYKSYEFAMNEDTTNYYGMDLKTYIKNSGQTEEEFKEGIITQQVEPMMGSLLMYYAIFDKENMTVTSKEVDAEIEATLEAITEKGIDREYLTDYFGEYYFESIVVSEKVLKFIYENAKIS